MHSSFGGAIFIVHERDYTFDNNYVSYSICQIDNCSGDQCYGMFATALNDMLDSSAFLQMTKLYNETCNVPLTEYLRLVWLISVRQVA